MARPGQHPTDGGAVPGADHRPHPGLPVPKEKPDDLRADGRHRPAALAVDLWRAQPKGHRLVLRPAAAAGRLARQHLRLHHRTPDPDLRRQPSATGLDRQAGPSHHALRGSDYPGRIPVQLCLFRKPAGTRHPLRRIPSPAERRGNRDFRRLRAGVLPGKPSGGIRRVRHESQRPTASDQRRHP